MTNTTNQFPDMTPRQVHDLQANGQTIDLVDVRTDSEYPKTSAIRRQELKAIREVMER